MLNTRKAKKRPMASQINKFITEYPDLKFDGCKIWCNVCEISLMCWYKSDCEKHVRNTTHTNKKNGMEKFVLDLLLMFTTCALPLNLLNKQQFQHFWYKYNPKWKLPSQTGLRRYLPIIRENIENRIIAVLRDKQLWLCVDETTDRKKNSIVNVIVRVLHPLKPTFAILLASKRLEKCTAEAITRVVLDTLIRFQVSPSQLLMFMSDGATIMRLVGSSLQEHCVSLLHVTCKVHALHLVAEIIPSCYPQVNALIANTKNVFLKSPKRIRAFHKQCPGIPEPPQPVPIYWGAWLKAAFYYCKHLHQIKTLILKFNADEAAPIKESQKLFQDPSVERDLKAIYDNYIGLVDAIEKLQNTGLSLVESVQIVDEVRTLLHAITDGRNKHVVEKFESIFNEDSDFITLRQICSGVSAGPLTNFKDYFNYACVTSIDVERSFSRYKNIFSHLRTKFTETNVETYLMLQTFHDPL